MGFRYAKVVARCKGCDAKEYHTPKGRTDNYGIDASGLCKACRWEAKQAK